MNIINNKSYQNNKEKCNVRSKKYYENNREKILTINKEYGKTHPEIRRKATAKYLKNNPEYYKLYRKNRYNTNYQFKLRIILGNRLNEILKKKTLPKAYSIIKLIGCSLDELKQHIEQQFKPEMNWSNHGSYWEIDHIIPCDAYNLEDEDQQKQCFHYTNLQPLFKTENRQKSNKII